MHMQVRPLFVYEIAELSSIYTSYNTDLQETSKPSLVTVLAPLVVLLVEFLYQHISKSIQYNSSPNQPLPTKEKDSNSKAGLHIRLSKPLELPGHIHIPLAG